MPQSGLCAALNGLILPPRGCLQVDSLEVCFRRIRPINLGRDHAQDFSKSFHLECLKFTDL